MGISHTTVVREDSSMPNYKLTNFNNRGRAESIRLTLAAAGVKYEDNRIEKEEWTELKPTMPFAQLPVLEVDGRKLAQSMTICRYLADRYKLIGRNPIERSSIEACCDTITDIREKLFDILGAEEDPEEEKNKKLGVYMQTTLPDILGKLETCLKRNKGGDKFFFGDKMSLADIHFYGCCENIMMMAPESLRGFPKLDALYDRVKNQPKIQKWLEDRPVTEY